MIWDEFAPAKVNLFLHVGPLRPDGFHPIASLMAFADVGDRLTARAADRFSLTMGGPFSAHAPAGEDNLVVRAVRALCPEAHEGGPWLELTLDKQLPAESGLGGGSSDAAATLRLVRQALELDVDGDRMQAIAATLGSDVPACLHGRPVIARGRGEELSPVAGLPPLPAVLVRPLAGSATGPVYRAFDEAGADEDWQRQPPWPKAFTSPDAFKSREALIEYLRACRNDLETPAVRLEPAIGEVLGALRTAPEVSLARMSGSGSACFGLCTDDGSARTLAARLSLEHPDWWVTACRFGGPWR